MSIRDANGSGKVVHEGPAINSTKRCTDCFGGHGAYASMPDYFKILMSLLLDDEKVLKKETTKMMFEPQLSEESIEAQKKLWTDPANTKLFVGEFPPTFVDREASLCGLYGDQVKLPRDTKTGEMITLFEKAMYKRSMEKKAKM
ncbi:hypothetical protein OEA41_009738 [Lepraria neglecta]|uniref:Uncharacterized protein n=1 Tax=Lepraria neglecta TaxID=209136 RepID=A0AAE0DHY9_9LECA|nr:hypothetical protein OEA41_009738 [Lepraria neglecta]